MEWSQLTYSKTCLKWQLKIRQNTDLNDKWSLNEGRKYCRMHPLEHYAILLTCINRQSVLKTIFGLLFECPLKTGFTVHELHLTSSYDLNIEAGHQMVSLCTLSQ